MPMAMVKIKAKVKTKMAKIIDGKAISKAEREKIAKEAEELKNLGILPGLAVIIVGDDPASAVYVRNKERACEEVGIYSEVIRMPENASEEEIIANIEALNANGKIHGILVQLPLPKGLDETKILSHIKASKDVDAFLPENVGLLSLGRPDMLPCTPAGVMTLLAQSGIDVCGKECVVVGRSNIVGKPMAMLLLLQNGTVTVCHSKTKNIADITRRADILVCAVGKPKFITADMVKSGACVIDVGINRGDDGKLCGDVDFENVKEIAGYITPVPGGVGPMTITSLLKNTVKSAKNSQK